MRLLHPSRFRRHRRHRRREVFVPPAVLALALAYAESPPVVNWVQAPSAPLKT